MGGGGLGGGGGVGGVAAAQLGSQHPGLPGDPGDPGDGVVIVFLKKSGHAQPSIPSPGTANPPTSPDTWVTAFPTPEAGYTIWQMMGTKETDETNYTWLKPFPFFEALGVETWIDGSFGFDLGSDPSKLDGIAAAATNNNVYNGNTSTRSGTTGTAGDIFFDTTLNELYIWE